MLAEQQKKNGSWLKLFYVGLITIVLFLLGWFLKFENNSLSLISPVLGISKDQRSEDVWYPSDSPKHFPNAPEVSAEAAYFIETSSGEVLYAKNSDQKRPIASLVKIMTAIVALENGRLSERLEVSQRAAEMEPDKMYLKAGDILAVEDLLKGIFLVSANDASEVLAEGITLNRGEFIKLMNTKASLLGLNNTLFINPSGLEEDDPNLDGHLIPQHSTAKEVAVMSRYAIKKFPKLLEISSQPYIFIEANNYHQAYELNSGINLLTTYPGVVGFKTGYTPEAGLTLVTVARSGEREVLGVLLNATERRDDAKLLLDYSFQRLGI